MAELKLAERSCLEVGRDRDGVYMWRVKIYFPDATDLNKMVAVIDRMLACKGYVESKLGKPPAGAGAGVDRPTEAGRDLLESTDDIWKRLESAAKRALQLDMQVGRLGNLVNIMEQRVKIAESKAEDIDLSSIPVSRPEEKEKEGEPESEKA